MITHLLLALGLSAAAIAILVKGLRVRPNTPAWSLFVILFFAIWAGGLWVAPVGSSAGVIVWLPFLLIAVLLTVLVGARVISRSWRSSARSRQGSVSSSSCWSGR
jgi:hypothetical protein